MSVEVLEPIPKKVMLTYEDYCDLPDDRNRYQIIEGELHVSPSPSVQHQRISRRLLMHLVQFTGAKQLGEVFNAPCDNVLSDINVVVPDLMFISNGRRQIITDKNIQGAPDLVIEIISPSTRRLDTERKRELYARFGVLEYWLVDPVLECIEVLTLDAGEYKQHAVYNVEDTPRSPLLPGLEIELEPVFA